MKKNKKKNKKENIINLYILILNMDKSKEYYIKIEIKYWRYKKNIKENIMRKIKIR